MKTDYADLPVVRLKDAKLNQLMQVPFFDYIYVFNRAALVIFSACFAGSASGSFAAGISVFCALCAIIGAIRSLKE